MELRNLYIVTCVIDGDKETHDSVFLSESLAHKRKNEIESRFSTDVDFEGATIETHKLVRDRGFDVNIVWRVDYITNDELHSTMFYNSKARAEKKYNEINNAYSLTEIELERFYVTGKNIISNKIGTLDY